MRTKPVRELRRGDFVKVENPAGRGCVEFATPAPGHLALLPGQHGRPTDQAWQVGFYMLDGLEKNRRYNVLAHPDAKAVILD